MSLFYVRLESISIPRAPIISLTGSIVIGNRKSLSQVGNGKTFLAALFTFSRNGAFKVRISTSKVLISNRSSQDRLMLLYYYRKIIIITCVNYYFCTQVCFFLLSCQTVED